MHLSNRTGMTQVEINSCWREALRHENAHRTLNEDFDFNPKNLMAVSTKPGTDNSMPHEEVVTRQELQNKFADTQKFPK